MKMPLSSPIFVKRTSQGKLALLHQAHEVSQMLFHKILRDGRVQGPTCHLDEPIAAGIFLQRVGAIGFRGCLLAAGSSMGPWTSAAKRPALMTGSELAHSFA